MSNSNLRDKLLELETYPEDLTESMREVMYKRERPFKKWERPFIILCCVVMAMALVGAGVMVVTDAPCPISKAPKYLWVAFGIAVVLLCCALVMLLNSLKRGTWRLRDDQYTAYAGAGFVFYMYLGSLFFSKRAPNGVDIGAYMLFAVILLAVWIESAEVRVREQILRNELAVAKLAELVAELKSKADDK
jgi:hypothetical protein